MTCGQVLFVLGVAAALLPSCNSAAELPEPLEGPYLGQQPPGPTRATFAPGFVSTRARELNATFTPEGDELYFTRRIDERMTLMVSRRVEGVWTAPEIVGFSGVFDDVDPFVSRDGSRLYFSSKRPIDGDGEEKDADLWFVERQAGGGWGEPVRLEELATEEDDYYTSVSDEGVLYFSIFDLDGKGDIYRAREEDGRFGVAEKVEAPISTGATEHDPFIAPDGSYLIFTSDRAGGRGSGDLWISFAAPDGSWAEPVNMNAVNSPGYDFCAMLSPDGRYLFFTSSVGRENDVFWVDAGVIEESRPPGN
jgi:hypothetical protein